MRIYKKLKYQKPGSIDIQPYIGVGLESINSQIKIAGIATIKSAKISNTKINNIKLLVVDNLKQYDCILGRDMINMIPKLQQAMEQLTENVRDFDHNVESTWSSESSSETIQYEDELRILKDGTITFPGFLDDLNTVVEETSVPKNNPSSCYNETTYSKEETNHLKPDPKHTPVNSSKVRRQTESSTIQSKIENARANILAFLTSCSSEKLERSKSDILKTMEFKIELLEPNKRPIRFKARPLPHSLKSKVQEALNEQLEAGLIKPSKSEWAAPLHIVHKTNGDIRMTVDYKALNDVIAFDPYPMPNAKDLFNKLAKSRYFSKFDFVKAYHQISTSKESIKYTSFVCEFGQFEYPTMPMGIKTAAAWFQRCVDKILKPFVDEGILQVYLDDVILHTETIEEHEAGALKLIEAIQKAGLKVSPVKCVILTESVKFLGHIISQNEVKTDPERSECIRDMKKPTTIQGLQSALGIFGYQRDFVKDFQKYAQPLYSMQNLKIVPDKYRKKNGQVKGKLVTLEWTDHLEECFYKLRDVCSEELKLSMPDFNYPFDLRTDACDYAYGAYLSQTIDDQVRVIGYYSKSFTKAQRNYSTSEQELLAIVMAIEFFHIFLYGHHFTVWTDHMPLTHMLKKQNTSKRLERWMTRLLLYHFTIKFTPGADNEVADFLSRMPEQSAINRESEDYKDVLIAYLEALDKHIEPEDLPSSSDELNTVTETVEQETTNDYEVHQHEQSLDSDLVWIMDILKENKEKRPKINSFDNITRKTLYRNYNSLRVINDLLYHEKEDKKGEVKIQFVLPAQSVEKVLYKIHNSVYGGHLGRRKTRKKVTARFYRPHLKEEIEKYIKTCHACQMVKTVPSRRAALNYLKPDRPNQIVASDFTGPFKTSKSGNKYIQVICDCFGKTLVLAASPNKETKSAAKNIVNKWILVYGVPEVFLSDGGKEYQSCLWDNICDLLDIERVKTTPFHPECDGQSERAVGTTKRMLTNYISEEMDNWDENLDALAFAYNTSCHRITGCTPFSAMFLREARIPVDLTYPNTIEWTRPRITEISQETTIRENYNQTDLPEEFDQIPDIDPDDLTPTEVSEYIKRLKHKLQNNYDLLRRNKVTRMQRVKEKHDRRIKKAKYNTGDLVLCSNPIIKKGQSRGLAPKYYGPLKILATNKNGCDYLVKRLDKPKSRAKQVHHNNLKAYFDRGLNYTEKPPDRNTTVADDPPTQLRMKRKYVKNPDNPRWRKSKANDTNTDSSSCLSTDADDEFDTEHATIDESTSSEDIAKNIPIPRRGRERRSPDRFGFNRI